MKFLQRWLWKTGLCLLIASTACAVTQAQEIGGYYTNRRVCSGFVEYSNDSSHMLLGYAEGRQISAVGLGMERRSFLSNHLSGAWVAEVRPFITVTDPTMKGIYRAVSPAAYVFRDRQFHFARSGGYPGKQHAPERTPVTQNHVYAGTATYMGGTRSTYVTAFSPLGYKLSGFQGRRIQPFVTGLEASQ